jgi:hypothetical protein
MCLKAKVCVRRLTSVNSCGRCLRMWSAECRFVAKAAGNTEIHNEQEDAEEEVLHGECYETGEYFTPTPRR